MAHTVDSFRFIGGISKRMIKTWIEMEQPRPIPWTPLRKPLSECRVALLSSAGVALSTDQPFDQEGERRNPWWGDPSYRVIPADASEQDVAYYHLHTNPRHAEQDINVLLPLARLAELAAAGEIGSAAPRAYSIMGYILQPEELLQVTVPQIVRNLEEDLADVMVLVPA